ncbi:MAG TPA: acyltransferase [Candidatus Baltobacteraceae bacterium]|nr:acyltransferase [Candidatus Baltobacteraceae bacterium]
MNKRRAVVVGFDYHARYLARVLNEHCPRWSLAAYSSKRTGMLQALYALRHADVLVSFGGPGPSVALAEAAQIKHVPVLVVWAGSDVQIAAENPFDLAVIRRRGYDNVAVAPWLVEELAPLGIAATTLAERITMGTGVFVDHRAYLNASTVNGSRGYIAIGDAVEIGPYCVLWGGGGVEIGSNVHMGAHVHVTSQQGRKVPPEQSDPHLPLVIDCAPVRIEDHVLIYSGAIIIPGVTIGHHATIAAGSVVIDDIPPYATAAGAPARVVRRDAIA